MLVLLLRFLLTSTHSLFLFETLEMMWCGVGDLGQLSTCKYARTIEEGTSIRTLLY